MTPAPGPPVGNAGTGVVARWALHVALIAALGAFVVSRDDRSVLVLLVPLALLPALHWRRAPRLLVVLLPALARGALLGAFVVAMMSTQLRLVRLDVGEAWAGYLGWGLAVLGVVFILGHRIWRVSATLVPTIVGLVVVSGLDPLASLFPWFAAASGLALWVYAFVSGGPRRLGVPLAVFLLVSVLTAAGTARFLPWAQPHVEQMVMGTFAEGTTGLAEESRLGEFGELAVSNRVVLRVWTAQPRLLRAYVHTRFDGREWTSPAVAPGPQPVRPTGVPAAARCLTEVPGPAFLLGPEPVLSLGPEVLVETRVLQSVIRDWPLLVPARPLLVRAPTSSLLRSPGDELRWPPFEPARLYGVVHDPAGRVPRLGDEGLAVRTAALGLPGRLDPRLRVLAGTLAGEAPGGRARLEHTVEWLHANFTYSLDVGEFRTDDPLAEFLLEKKSGYCEYFASAAAVLLRLQGVPTRYVKGFAVGPQNFVPGRLGVGDHYVVRESDAHAWVEAWIEGEGWVEADPTPPDGFAALHEASSGWLASLLEAGRVHAAALWARLMHEGLAGLGKALAAAAGWSVDWLWRHPVWVGLLTLALAAAVSWRRIATLLARLRAARRARRERSAAFPGELGQLLAVAERRWVEQGRARPPARGLREHVESLPPELLSPREREASLAIVAACYRSAYGGRLPTPDELEDLRAAAARLD